MKKPDCKCLPTRNCVTALVTVIHVAHCAGTPNWQAMHVLQGDNKASRLAGVALRLCGVGINAAAGEFSLNPEYSTTSCIKRMIQKVIKIVQVGAGLYVFEMPCC